MQENSKKSMTKLSNLFSNFNPKKIELEKKLYALYAKSPDAEIIHMVASFSIEDAKEKMKKYASKTCGGKIGDYTIEFFEEITLPEIHQKLEAVKVDRTVDELADVAKDVRSSLMVAIERSSDTNALTKHKSLFTEKEYKYLKDKIHS